MLRRAICLSYGQSGSLAYRWSSTSLQQYTVLASRPAFSSFRKADSSTRGSRRTLSTRNDEFHEAQSVQGAHKTHKEGLKQDSSTAEDYEVKEVEDDRDTAFITTPRFHSRLRVRWTDPNHEEDSLEPENDELTVVDDGGHFIPLPVKQRQRAVHSLTESIGDLIQEMRVPLSPLERKARSEKDVPKRQSTEQEVLRLSYNPWANMLAGSMRLDTASKVRLPQSLLVIFGEVSNPEETARYLLPEDLADLEAFDKQLRNAFRKKAMEDLPRERGGGRIRILPYKLLVEDLTNELVVWDNKTSQGRTKHGVVMKRLLPPRWLERNQQIKAYQNASKEYWKLKETQNELDEGLFKKPETPSDLLTTQWQPNIAERMLSLMRQRLLLSIDHLGRKTDNPRDIIWEHFTCFEWPDSLCLDVVNKSSGNSSLLSDVYEQPNRADTEHNEAMQHRETLAELKTPDDEHIQDGAPDLSSYNLKNPNFWLPGSFFLHIGPPEIAQIALSSSPGCETLTEEQSLTSRSASKLNPPMIAVNNNIRLPVFNLSALLGPKFDHPLHQILTLRSMTAPKNSGDDSDNGNYLIHIRANAPGSQFILKELWQLWRYVGGTDCFQPLELQSIKEEGRTGAQMEKDRLKKYLMQKKVWDNFYAFLPDIERDPAEMIRLM